MNKHALRNLSDLTSLELKIFLDSIDNVLCDCDGVLWMLQKPIVDADKCIYKLKDMGKRVGTVSNNALRNLNQYHELFKKFNFDIEIENIIYPTVGVIHYLKSIDFEKEVFVIGSSAMRDELAEAGFKLTDPEEIYVQESLETLCRLLVDDENVGAVVLDSDLNCTYLKIAKAAMYLHRPEVLFIIGAGDKGVKYKGYPPIIGQGGIQKAIQEFTERKPIVLAKPGEEFNEVLKTKFNIKDPSRTLFVGDSLPQDIGFANRHGYQSLLVLSGEASLEEARATSGHMVPDFYIKNLGELYDLIAKKLNV